MRTSSGPSNIEHSDDLVSVPDGVYGSLITLANLVKVLRYRIIWPSSIKQRISAGLQSLVI